MIPSLDRNDDANCNYFVFVGACDGLGRLFGRRDSGIAPHSRQNAAIEIGKRSAEVSRESIRPIRALRTAARLLHCTRSSRFDKSCHYLCVFCVRSRRSRAAQSAVHCRIRAIIKLRLVIWLRTVCECRMANASFRCNVTQLQFS